MSKVLIDSEQLVDIVCEWCYIWHPCNVYRRHKLVQWRWSMSWV